MFFIMGISDGEKQLKFDQPMVCPCCSQSGCLQVTVEYMFFSLFFIPLFKWNKRYFVKTSCCSAVAELEKVLGRSIESGDAAALDLQALRFSRSFGGARRCAACGYETAEHFQYCPKCGHPL